MMLQSTTRRPSRPWTRSLASTTASGSRAGPHLAGAAGMEDRSAGVPGEFEQIVIGHGRRPGAIFARDVGGERAGRRQAARQANAGDERRAVARASTGSSAASPAAANGSVDLDPHGAARFRPQLADRQREARRTCASASPPCPRTRWRHETARPASSRAIGAREDAALIDADRHRAAAGEQRSRAPSPACATSSEVVVGRDRLGALEDHARLQMVLQVFADAGQPCTIGMPKRRSSARGPMPESCSSCGDCSAPAAEDHFAPRALTVHSRAACR